MSRGSRKYLLKVDSRGQNQLLEWNMRIYMCVGPSSRERYCQAALSLLLFAASQWSLLDECGLLILDPFMRYSHHMNSPVTASVRRHLFPWMIHLFTITTTSALGTTVSGVIYWQRRLLLGNSQVLGLFILISDQETVDLKPYRQVSFISGCSF